MSSSVLAATLSRVYAWPTVCAEAAYVPALDEDFLRTTWAICSQASVSILAAGVITQLVSELKK